MPENLLRKFDLTPEVDPDVQARRDVLAELLGEDYKVPRGQWKEIAGVLPGLLEERLGRKPSCATSQATLNQDQNLLRVASDWLVERKRSMKVPKQYLWSGFHRGLEAEWAKLNGQPAPAVEPQPKKGATRAAAPDARLMLEDIAVALMEAADVMKAAPAYLDRAEKAERELREQGAEVRRLRDSLTERDEHVARLEADARRYAEQAAKHTLGNGGTKHAAKEPEPARVVDFPNAGPQGTPLRYEPEFLTDHERMPKHLRGKVRRALWVFAEHGAQYSGLGFYWVEHHTPLARSIEGSNGGKAFAMRVDRRWRILGTLTQEGYVFAGISNRGSKNWRSEG